MQFTQILAALCSAAIAVGSTVASAEPLPAVSAPNAKLSFEGGRLDDTNGGVALGSYTIPLAPAVGFQIDGALGRMGDEVLGGVGAHLFTRNPERYLLGVFSSYHTWNSIDIWRLAAESELYIDRVSISGLAGYEGLRTPNTIDGLEVIQPDKSRFFTHIDLAYYLTDDLKVFAGYRFEDDVSFAGAGAEYMLRTVGAPISLFARGNFGQSEHASVTGGVKIHLGSDPGKTLIQRHRMDDPQIYVPVFPKLATKAQSTPGGPTICSVDIDDIVTSPSSGTCVCPSGSFREGQPPVGSGPYYCGAA